MISAACAEMCADVFLCPWEAMKVKMQVAEKGEFPRTARESYTKMMNEGGMAGFYKGLVPLLSRQVPYTVMKFTMFENTVGFVYQNMFTRPKESYSRGTQLGISFACGYWAGIFTAIVSHPGDTLVSFINKRQSNDSTIV